MMKKRLIVVSAAIAMLMLGQQVMAHRAAEDEEQADKVIEQANDQANQDEPYIENFRVGPIGPEVHTGPKDFSYCKCLKDIDKLFRLLKVYL
jgi:ligand-binding sensor protein